MKSERPLIIVRVYKNGYRMETPKDCPAACVVYDERFDNNDEN